MTDRISVEDLTEALEYASGFFNDETRLGEALATVLAAARLLVDNPAVLEALQDGEVIERETWLTLDDEFGEEIHALAVDEPGRYLVVPVITRGQETE